MVASEVQQQQQQDQHPQQQHGQHPAPQPKPCWPTRAWQYARRNPLELAASTLESMTLVLVVFVQDIAFKQSIPICAGLLTASFILHGLAYKAGQCQVWPKVIEMAAPLLFYGLTPPAYLATHTTYRSAFIIINFWFVVAELGFIVLAQRNFIEEYLQDWSPNEIWGTPLIQHCARVVAASWIICQVIMGLAQAAVVAANISIDNDLVAGIMMCYVMQLLPLLWAVVFTFAYPARVRRRWGYKPGVRETCYPPPPLTSSASPPAAAGAAVLGRPGACCEGGAIAVKDADANLVSDVDGGESCNTMQGCGWGGWGGGRWQRIKHSGSSMRWLLGAPNLGSGRSSSSSGSGHPDAVQMVVGED